MDSPTVFISYARSTGARWASAIAERLGPGGAFFDRLSVSDSSPFPARIARAIGEAKVFVLILDGAYFTRPWCVLEFEHARTRYDSRIVHATGDDANIDDELSHIVVALGPEDAGSAELLRLPPALRRRAWPTADNVEAVVSLVRNTLARNREHHAPTRDEICEPRSPLEAGAELPPPYARDGIVHGTTRVPPSLGADFFGRSALMERILFELSTRAVAHGYPRVAALSGWGGIGKTRLAIEFVRRFGATFFPGGQFWLTASARDDRNGQFIDILRALNPKRAAAVDTTRISEVEQALTQELSEVCARGPILWTVDDLPHGSTGVDEVARWCPDPSLKAGVVITTRDVLALPGTHTLPVSALDRPGCVGLLRNQLQQSDLTLEAAATIADWLGDYPLAAELVNRNLRLGGVAQDWLNRARNSRPTQEVDQCMALLREVVPGIALRGITEVLVTTLAALPSAARRLAEVLAHFGPTPLPRTLVDALGDIARPQAQMSLIHINLVGGASKDVFGSMHRVVSDFLRRQVERRDEVALPSASMRLLAGLISIPSKQSQYEQDRAAAIRCVLQVTSMESPKDGRERALLGEILPHAWEIFRRPPPTPGAPVVEADISLGLRIGHAEDTLGHPGPALAAYFECAAAARGRFGPINRLTIQSQLGVALCRRTLDNSQGALEMAMAAGRALESSRPEQDPERLECETVVAALWWEVGDRDEAMRRTQILLERLHRARPTLAQLENLLFLLNQLAANRLHDLARRELERALSWLEALPSVSDVHALVRVKVLVAEVVEQLGDRAEALRRGEEVLKLSIAVNGPEHPATARIRLMISRIELAFGQASRARHHAETAIDALERNLGDAHPQVASARAKLANVLVDDGVYAGAVNELQRVVAQRTSTHGGGARATLSARIELAEATANAGQLEHAIVMLDQLAKECVERCGLASKEAIEAKNLLGATLCRRGRHEDARRTFQDVLADMTAYANGGDPAQRCGVEANLAVVLGNLGRHTEACLSLERSLVTARHVFGDSDDRVAICMSNLGIQRREARQFEQALKIQREALVIWEKTHKPRHPNATRMRREIAITLRRMGRGPEATALYNQAYHEWRSELGPTHPDTFKAGMDLGLVLSDYGRYDLAREHMEEFVMSLAGDDGAEGVAVDEARGLLAYVMMVQDDWATIGYWRTGGSKYGRWFGSQEEEQILIRLDAVANRWAQSGDPEHARRAQENLVSRLKALHGMAHRLVHTAQLNLAQTFCDLGEYSKAESLAKEAHSAATAIPSYADTDRAGVASQLADVLTRCGKLEEAMCVVENAYAQALITLGTRHDATAQLALQLLGDEFNFDKMLAVSRDMLWLGSATDDNLTKMQHTLRRHPHLEMGWALLEDEDEDEAD